MRRAVIAGLAAMLIGCAPQLGEPNAGPEPQATIPEGPDMRLVRVPAGETPCRSEIGEAAATRLVRCETYDTGPGDGAETLRRQA